MASRWLPSTVRVAGVLFACSYGTVAAFERSGSWRHAAPTILWRDGVARAAEPSDHRDGGTRHDSRRHRCQADCDGAGLLLTCCQRARFPGGTVTGCTDRPAPVDVLCLQFLCSWLCTVGLNRLSACSLCLQESHKAACSSSASNLMRDTGQTAGQSQTQGELPNL